MKRHEWIAARDLAVAAHASAQGALALLDETALDITATLAKHAVESAWALVLVLNNEVEDSYSRPEVQL